MISHRNRYAKTFHKEQSENPCYNYQVATDTAMTGRMIMMLLCGSDREPVRAEAPILMAESHLQRSQILPS